MRKIYLSKYGIHFETNAGQINAHWTDLFGISGYTFRYERKVVFNKLSLLYIKRFWEQIGKGIIFIIKRSF